MLVAFLSLSTCLYSGTIDPHVSDKVYVEYGKKFDCVGKLCGSYKDGVFFCASAVAISDRWIVTAAHVVKDATKCKITINNKEVCVAKFFYKKEFDLNEIGKNDIAIGYCEENIDLKSYPEIYLDSDEIGKKCDIVGYGMTGTFISGAVKLDDKKRAGCNVIDGTFNDTLVCTPSHRTSRDYTDKEFIIASGDSGGGLFIDGKLAGISSFVSATDKKANSSYTDEGCHTRISVYKDWINSIIK